MHILEYLSTLIAPHRCLSCGAEPLPLCHPCTKTLLPAPDCCYKCARPASNGLCADCQSSGHLSSITVRTLYGTTAEQLIHQLKFVRVKAAADCIARAMAPVCPRGLITHVPTASKRIRQRGYDQAALIAKHLAKHTNQQYLPLLGRIGSQRQLGNNRKTRQNQLINAYFVLQKAKSIGVDTPVILLDDVLTTGATLESAAATLRKAGHKNIHAIVFASVRSQP